MENLEKHLKDICRKDSDGTFDDYNERQISQEIVLPILFNLGWTITDAKEVYPEFRTKFNFRIDYALILNGIHKVLIEVKRKSVELDEKAEEQLEKYLREYSNTNFVCVLTNGLMWKFYVYNEKDERIELVSVVVIENASASKRLSDFLSKEKVANGDAIKILRELKKSQTDPEYEKIMEEGWSYLFSNDFLQEELTKLINNEVLLLNGFSVGEEDLRNFIGKKLQAIIPAVIPRKSQFKGNLRIISYKKPRKVIIHTSSKGMLKFGNMKLAIKAFVEDISYENPKILEDYYNSDENHGRLHNYIAKSFDELTDKGSTVEANGWHINVNLEHEKVFKYIWEPLCKRMGKTPRFIELP
ncbi:MAG: type I restriction endonuclease [Marinilabiliaceae bacterium]|nr:type I restriction endonuclease [Marinilabiliaceae bacterium]